MFINYSVLMYNLRNIYSANYYNSEGNFKFSNGFYDEPWSAPNINRFYLFAERPKTIKLY